MNQHYDMEKQVDTPKKNYPIHLLYLGLFLISTFVFIQVNWCHSSPPQVVSLQHSTAKQPQATESVQESLMEMFSIYPMIVLQADPKESSMLNNIFSTLNINPEPKLVDLAKHPNQEGIIQYLQNFENHRYGDTDIPLVFIGGDPICNYNQIVEKYKSGELAPYLRSNGRGIIEVHEKPQPQVSKRQHIHH